MACQADAITCAIRDLTAAVRADGPSPLDWLTLVVSLLAAGATVYLGTRANKASTRAVDIAEKSFKAETARDGAQYRSLMSDKLSRLFDEFADYSAEMQSYLRAKQMTQAAIPRPAINKTSAAIEQCLLVASEEDQVPLAHLARVWGHVRGGDVNLQSHVLALLLVEIRKWWTTDQTAAEFERSTQALVDDMRAPVTVVRLGESGSGN